MKGKTVIAIAHRLSTLKEMDRLVVMDNGKIIADETELIDVYDSMLTMKGLWMIYKKNRNA